MHGWRPGPSDKREDPDFARLKRERESALVAQNAVAEKWKADVDIEARQLRFPVADAFVGNALSDYVQACESVGSDASQDRGIREHRRFLERPEIADGVASAPGITAADRYSAEDAALAAKGLTYFSEEMKLQLLNDFPLPLYRIVLLSASPPANQMTLVRKDVANLCILRNR